MEPTKPARGRGPLGVPSPDQVLAQIREHRATRLLLGGAIVGAAAGVTAAAVDRMIVWVSELVHGTAEPSADAVVSPLSVAGPIVLGALASWAVWRFTRRHRPQGVADVLARVHLGAHPLSARDGVVSALGAAVAVGAGLSGGREGPTVQIGSAIAGRIVSFFEASPAESRALIAAGGAAGVAASFDTPIAGAFFALEILLGNFAMDAFTPVVVATVVGTVVGQALLGDRIALHLPAFELHHPLELLGYVVVGLAGGVAAIGFARALEWSSRAADRLGAPPFARGAVAGALSALALVGGGQAIMGNGYAYVERLIAGDVGVLGAVSLAAVLLLKIVATGLTGAARTGAGIFAPSLFVGAVTGALVGVAFHQIAPSLVGEPGATAVVGMAVVAGSALHAPITMTLMLFEMTGNYAIVLPTLAAVAVGSLVTRLARAPSVYEDDLARQGVDLREAPEAGLSHLTVADVVRSEGFETIDPAAPVGEAVNRFLARRVDCLYVRSEDGRYGGVIDLQDLKSLFGQGAATGALAERVREVAPLREELDLGQAIGAFFRCRREELPVVDAHGSLVGVLVERDVVAAYNREVLRQSTPLARVVQETADRSRTDFLELPEGMALEVVDVPASAVGRTVREEDLGARFGCTILAIRSAPDEDGERARRAVTPGSSFAAGDDVVVLGPTEAIERLVREWVAT